MGSWFLALVIVSVLTYAAPILAGAANESQAASAGTDWTVALYWVPFLLFIGVWLWLARRFYSNRPMGYFGYIKRALEHMDRVEQKLDAIRELLERNERGK